MHLMIDFETLDTAPSAVVVSTGIALFDTNKIIDSKYWVHDLQTQLRDGRTISQDTLRWWFTQSPQAQEPLKPESSGLLEPNFKVLKSIDRWVQAVASDLNQNWGDVNVWSNGANFDEPILAHLFRHNEMEIPYQFWNVRCFRTFDVLTKCRELVKRQGTHHNAEDDARYQAECVIAYFKKKRKK